MSTPSIGPEDVMYRQIGRGGNPIYYDAARNPPVHQSLFLPTGSDIDGLSLIQGKLRSQIWAAYRLEQPTTRFRLAALKVQSIQQNASSAGFGTLSFECSPDGLDNDQGEPWAHCVATEINRTAYDKDVDAKKKIKQWAMFVASGISQSDVLGPFAEPTDDDAYRP